MAAEADVAVSAVSGRVGTRSDIYWLTRCSIGRISRVERAFSGD